MLDQFKHTIYSDFPTLNQRIIYLAISGGKDSMALLHLLLKSGLSPVLLHCNFQLRDKESDGDEKFVQNIAQRHELELFCKHFDTATIAEEQKLTIQETARKLRYEWFNSFLEQNDSLLLTAHHLDDTIETFFINLMRGTGLKGLGGIPYKQGKVYRPLLSFSQTSIQQFISNNDIDYREDSSNKNDKYLRNHLRLNVIPEIKNECTDFERKMEKTMLHLQTAQTFIEGKAEKFRSQHFYTENNHAEITICELSNLLRESSFFLQYILHPFGIHINSTESFNQFLHSKTGASYESETHDFLIDRKRLLIREKNGKETDYSPVKVNQLPAQLKLADKTIRLESFKGKPKFGNENLQYISYSANDLPLTVRIWKKGDRIRPLGMKNTKLISDVLIDKKITLWEKEKIVVVENAIGEILSIPGLCIAESAKVTDQSDLVMTLNLNT